MANPHTCAHGTDTKTKCQCDLFQAVWFVHQLESLCNTPMCLEYVVPFLPKSQLLVLIHELIFIDYYFVFQILLQCWLNGNRICVIQFIMVIGLSARVQFGLQSYEWLTNSDKCEAGVWYLNHKYDYRQNWMTQGPVTN